MFVELPMHTPLVDSIKVKACTITSIDTERVFEKMNSPLRIKLLSKLETGRKVFNPIKAVYANGLSGDRMNNVPL